MNEMNVIESGTVALCVLPIVCHLVEKKKRGGGGFFWGGGGFFFGK